VLLVENPTKILVHHLLRIGIDGILAEGRACSDVLRAIDAVCAGKTFISAVIRKEIPIRRIDLNQKSRIEKLSRQERRVMALTLKSYSCSEAAVRLGLTSKTVETYRCRILEKLGTKNSVDLTRFAIEHGMI